MGFKVCKVEDSPDVGKQFIPGPTWARYYLDGKNIASMTREEILTLALDPATPRVIGDLVAERVKKDFFTKY